MSDPDAVADAVLDVIRSQAMASGRFDQVNGHEPPSRPGNGLTAAVWVDRVDPLPDASGLAVTTARLLVKERLYSNVDQEPRDAIDPNLTAAAWALIRALIADLRLADGQELDVQGIHGVALYGQAGYLEWPDGGMSRVMDLTIPIVIYDVWPQEG